MTKKRFSELNRVLLLFRDGEVLQGGRQKKGGCPTRLPCVEVGRAVVGWGKLGTGSNTNDSRKY